VRRVPVSVHDLPLRWQWDCKQYLGQSHIPVAASSVQPHVHRLLGPVPVRALMKIQSDKSMIDTQACGAYAPTPSQQALKKALRKAYDDA
jgi:hypothetical protein